MGRRRAQAPRVDRRRLLLGTGAAALLGLGTLTLVGRVADFGQVASVLRTAEPGWLALCVAGVVLAYVGYVAGYRDVTRADRGPVLAPATAARVVALGFGAVALGSAPGGLAVDFWALRRAGAGLHESVRRVLALNTMEWAVLGLACAVAGIAALVGAADGVPAAMALAWPALVSVCVAAALVVSAPGRAGRLARVDPGRRRRGLHGIAPRRPGTWTPWIADKLRVGFADAVAGLVLIRHVVSRPHRYPWGVGGFALYWLGELVVLEAALLAFSEPLGPIPLVLAYATGYAASALPLPAGGAGGVEASMAFSLHLTGVPLPSAVLAVFVYRLVTFWLPIIPSLAVAPSIPRLNEELLPASARQPF